MVLSMYYVPNFLFKMLQKYRFEDVKAGRSKRKILGVEKVLVLDILQISFFALLCFEIKKT